MSGQEGIDRLLQAEQEATEIVAKARKEKQARIKQARDEAEQEIAKFRQTLEQEFNSAQFQDLGGGDKSQKLAQQTEMQLQEIRRLAQANAPNVSKQILQWIWTVDTTVSK
mmetsp:Transcript_44419/g.89160  ORF Transcript_44419/g.89160 Transcript_44419/m.89160 type:complete len:111 (-) Transcript_44419:98-430(-)|eukprot:CAMPEP_0196727022 /NCGR_PEP_ID=MMETSP1091-20130531/8109_1 /TAXON_ID=302021 /ORGANISM="Rhodomonas sp., Strain CCMP768" /LENGTH=110 /DNA_ID=CAMNT_0042069545 /DNA_START=26 /DNA_END=358 /DNA_ORIENTATION=-